MSEKAPKIHQVHEDVPHPEQPKLPKSKILIAVVVIVIASAGAYLVMSKHAPTTHTASSPLQTDLQRITPHFIDSSKGTDQILTPEEQKVKDDVIALFMEQQPNNGSYYKNLWLEAVGNRYVLISQPSAESSHDEVIDSKTGKVTLIASGVRYYFAPQGRDVALYIDSQALRTYTLDQSDAVLIPGSQLSGNETYHSGQSDFQLTPVEKHTKNSITILVFDSSQIVQNPAAQPNEMQTMNKKVRDVTFSF